MYGRRTHNLHIAWETVRCCGTTMVSSCWKPIILKAGVLAGFLKQSLSLCMSILPKIATQHPQPTIFARIEFAVYVNPRF